MTIKFAKLFEREGNQVLVTLGEDDPSVIFKFEHDGVYVSPAISYKPRTYGDDAVNSVYDAAEKAFEKVDEDFAFDLRTKALTDLGLV